MLYTQRATVLAAASYDQDVVSWNDRVIANGGSVSSVTLRHVSDKFVKPLKAAGLWSQLRRVNLCCGNNLAASLVPLINTSGSATDTNANLLESDYSERLGWQTDGTTKSIATGYTPTETEGGLSVYLRTAISGVTASPIGCRNAGSTQHFRLLVIATNILGLWGGGGSNDTDVASGTLAAGFQTVTRTSSTLITYYLNGVSQDTETASTTPSTPSADVYVLAQNAGGSAAAWCPSGTRVAGYAIDPGLSAANALILSNAFRHFNAAMSRAV